MRAHKYICHKTSEEPKSKNNLSKSALTRGVGAPKFKRDLFGDEARSERGEWGENCHRSEASPRAIARGSRLTRDRAELSPRDTWREGGIARHAEKACGILPVAISSVFFCGMFLGISGVNP
jgi:hypothetical protein